MAAPEIDVRVGNVLKKVTPGNAWVRIGDRLVGVVGVFVRKGNALVTIWDYTPVKPANLHMEDQDHVSVTLQWGASAGAEKYLLLRRSGDTAKTTDKATVVTTITPADGTFWTNRTWKDTGLKEDSTYVYTVQAVNVALGYDVESPESNALKVNTGHTQRTNTGSSRHKTVDNPPGGADDEFVPWQEFQPTRIDTYSKAKEWATKAGRPGQGTYDQSENANRNQYGCVDYSGVYNRMVNLHGQVNVNGVTRNIADYIDVTSAEIQSIGRPFGSGEIARPTLRLHLGNFSIGTNITPSMLPGDEGVKDVAGPRVNESVGPIDIRNMWANHWSRPPSSRIYRGIVVYRADGEQTCTLAGLQEAGMPNSWDLRLVYGWSIVTRSGKAPTTTAYTWPA